MLHVPSVWLIAESLVNPVAPVLPDTSALLEVQLVQLCVALVHTLFNPVQTPLFNGSILFSMLKSKIPLSFVVPTSVVPSLRK